MVSILVCHTGNRGSIPRLGVLNFFGCPTNLIGKTEAEEEKTDGEEGGISRITRYNIKNKLCIIERINYNIKVESAI